MIGLSRRALGVLSGAAIVLACRGHAPARTRPATEPVPPPPAVTTAATAEDGAPPAPPVAAEARATPPASAGKTVAQVCAAIGERTQAILADVAVRAKAWRSAEGEPMLVAVDPKLFPGCLGDGAQGRWAVALESAAIDPEGGEYDRSGRITMQVALAWVAADGSDRRLRPSLRGDPDANVSLGDPNELMQVSQLHDFDRDGRPELVIEVISRHPDHPLRWLEVYRVGAAGPEAWAIEPRISALADIDADGVLDFVHDDLFAATQGMNTLGSRIRGVTHVTPGGKLATGDDAVKAWYRKVCPKLVRAAAIVRGRGAEASVTAAGCAWLWGEDPKAIDQRLNAVLGAAGLEVWGPWSEGVARPARLE